MDNIEYEKRIISLLGLKLIKNKDKYLIFDDDKNVGFIEKRRIKKSNPKKNISDQYGYVTEIHTNKLDYTSKRELDEIPKAYSFKLKNKNSNVDLQIDKEFFLKLFDKDNFIYFNFTQDKIHIVFNSQTENFNIEETIVFETSNALEYYLYTIEFINKDNEISKEEGKKNYTFQAYKVDEDNIFIQELNYTTLYERTRCTKNRCSEVPGTIKDLITKHEFGTDAYKHLRFLISKHLPFDDEVLDNILDNIKTNYKIKDLFLTEKEEKKKVLK